MTIKTPNINRRVPGTAQYSSDSFLISKISRRVEIFNDKDYMKKIKEAKRLGAERSARQPRTPRQILTPRDGGRPRSLVMQKVVWSGLGLTEMMVMICRRWSRMMTAGVESSREAGAITRTTINTKTDQIL